MTSGSRRVDAVRGIAVKARGKGPYPHRCDACEQEITAGETWLILEDTRVLHEVCAFLINDEAADLN